MEKINKIPFIIETSAGLMYSEQRGFTHAEYYSRMEHYNSKYNLRRESDPKEENELYPKIYSNIRGYNVIKEKGGEYEYMTYEEFDKEFPGFIKYERNGKKSTES